MAELVALLILLALGWLAYKVGRAILKLIGFLLSVVVGLIFLGLLLSWVAG